MGGLIDRLRARAAEDRSCQENNERVAALLKPELDVWQKREQPTNVYTVRMAIDHKRSAEKDKQLAEDLEQVIAMLEAEPEAWLYEIETRGVWTKEVSRNGPPKESPRIRNVVALTRKPT